MARARARQLRAHRQMSFIVAALRSLFNAPSRKMSAPAAADAAMVRPKLAGVAAGAPGLCRRASCAALLRLPHLTSSLARLAAHASPATTLQEVQAAAPGACTPPDAGSVWRRRTGGHSQPCCRRWPCNTDQRGS